MNSLYLHIPYCKTRCGYCDFHSSTCNDDQAEYVQALCQELVQRKNELPNQELGSIYFGGGTPTLLSLEQLAQIMSAIKANFSLEEDAEVTIEANPDDLNSAYLEGLIALNFNRISIGTQSFDDNDLKRIERRHSAKEAITAIKAAQKVGFKNISADLIFGLPFQTIEKWQNNLDQLLALKIQHISCYNLSYEEGTSFFKKKQTGEYQELDDETNLEMYKMLIAQAKNQGFIHYETSNFALKDCYSKHNSNYWTGAPYLGLGAGAHSYNGHTRRWNISDNKQYIAAVIHDQVYYELEEIDDTMAYNEFIMTGLRTMWGCNLSILKEKYGKKYVNYCLKEAEPHIKKHNILLENNTLTLSPEAIFISDQIMADLMLV